MLPTDSAPKTSVVFRCPSRRQCDERAFVLTAVDIAAAIGFDGQQYLLEVAEADAARARAHLDQYERERLPKPAPPAPIPSLPNAWVGCTIYALVLIVIGLLVSNGFWRLDAFNAGEIDAERVQAGQWWRAWTALTLHLDGAHLIANLAAGVWFGYLAARQIGSGITWLLVVTGAALANLLEALLGPPFHRSVGASTAVFTALGLLAAHSWRLRATAIQRWALRWAPLVGGVVLLGWFGTGGGGDDSEAIVSTDIVAHAGGFLIGVLFGAAAAQSRTQRWLGRVPQWLAGLTAIASILIAWVCALRS
jgi:rhomboid protease GluP